MKEDFIKEEERKTANMSMSNEEVIINLLRCLANPDAYSSQEIRDSAIFVQTRRTLGIKLVWQTENETNKKEDGISEENQEEVDGWARCLKTMGVAIPHQHQQDKDKEAKTPESPKARC
jgi:hypothetical protein